MIASLGAFTSLYGGDRPYQNRATLLAIVALSFALVVCLGVCTQPSLLGSIAASVLVAMNATFLCNALNVGPPGAYMFALACAVGTALQDVFGRIDRDKAKAGKALFIEHCASCHNAWPYRWTEANKYGKRFILVGSK